jgi:hypothetical protein
MSHNETTVEILRQVKHAIRHKYACPGGYPLFVLMHDGEALSCDAARENWRQICYATLRGLRDGWQAIGTEINWEDASLFCAHSGQKIESAYDEEQA